MADVYELAKSVGIEEVIGQYIPLVGPKEGHYLGLCPFHGDKKLGSFKVTPSKEVFKCWGCGMYGDNIDFVSSYLNVSSREAAIRICEDHHLITDAEAARLRGSYDREFTASYIPKIPERPKPVLSKKRTAEELHKVYLAFVRAAGLSLTEEFRSSLLNERKLREDELKDFFVYPNPSDADFWSRFRRELGATTGVKEEAQQDKLLLGVPGFYLNARGKLTFIGSSKSSIGIITRNRDGLISGIQMRVMEHLAPGERRYSFLSSGFADGLERSRGTYGCSCGYVEDVVLPGRSSKWCRAIAITEGRFKAMALARMGFVAVNMHSISNWNPAGDVALALADKVNAKRFVLVYDQEEKNKEAARKAVFKSSTSLANKLRDRLPTDFAVWDPQYGKGIDDVVNNGYQNKISRIPA